MNWMSLPWNVAPHTIDKEVIENFESEIEKINKLFKSYITLQQVAFAVHLQVQETRQKWLAAESGSKKESKAAKLLDEQRKTVEPLKAAAHAAFELYKEAAIEHLDLVEEATVATLSKAADDRASSSSESSTTED